MTYSIPDLDYMRDRIATVNAIKLYNQPKLIDMEREQQKRRPVGAQNIMRKTAQYQETQKRKNLLHFCYVMATLGAIIAFKLIMIYYGNATR